MASLLRFLKSFVVFVTRQELEGMHLTKLKQRSGMDDVNSETQCLC